MENIIQDVRAAVRVLLGSPGISAVALVSLALGIGANTAIFSVTNTVLLGSLAVDRPGELALVLGGRPTGLNYNFSYPAYQHLRDRNDAFSGMLAYSQLAVNLTSNAGTERIQGELVSGNYFSVLGVHPALGRGFTSAEDRTSHPVVILSHRLWRDRFGSDPLFSKRPCP